MQAVVWDECETSMVSTCLGTVPRRGGASKSCLRATPCNASLGLRPSLTAAPDILLPLQWCTADFGGVRAENTTALMLVRGAMQAPWLCVGCWGSSLRSNPAPVEQPVETPIFPALPVTLPTQFPPPCTPPRQAAGLTLAGGHFRDAVTYATRAYKCYACDRCWKPPLSCAQVCAAQL